MALPPSPGRYHLYVSWACPWAHRTLIMRTLKGLEGMIGVSATHWHMGEEGWTFDAAPGVIPDTVNNAARLSEIYVRAKPDYTGRVTVPVLWDTRTGTIVSNESADIVRMFNSAFDALGAREVDYVPEHLRAEIDALNERVYSTLNNGVYKCGFARSQEAYDRAIGPLFETMDWLDAALRTSASCSAMKPPRPIGGCSRRCSASMPSTPCTSSAACAGCPTTPTCGPTPATCTSSPASPAPPTWNTRGCTTTAARPR